MLGNGVARMLKKLRTSKGDYWIKQRVTSITPIFKKELLLKERICSQREQILSFMSCSLEYREQILSFLSSSLEYGKSL